MVSFIFMFELDTCHSLDFFHCLNLSLLNQIHLISSLSYEKLVRWTSQFCENFYLSINNFWVTYLWKPISYRLIQVRVKFISDNVFTIDKMFIPKRIPGWKSPVFFIRSIAGFYQFVETCYRYINITWMSLFGQK